MSFENRVPMGLSAIALLLFIVTLSACSDIDNSQQPGDIRTSNDAFAYRESSQYAPILKRCVLAGTVEESCSIQELPFIGDGTLTPTIDQVMDRVLVTHEWMGNRFEQALRAAPDDTLLTLFSSTTSVLIASDVRPSLYGSITAGIHLDPNYLWITSEEKSTVSTETDERSGFGEDLGFVFIARTADSTGERLSPFFSLTQRAERTTAQMLPALYRLLYHELTHAADFMPRHKIAGLDPSLPVFDAISDIRSDWLSNSLVADYPHTNDALKQLAQVFFAGVDATEVQQQVTAGDVGTQMSEGGAVQFYSYYTQQEDLAQLMEAALMAYHYDATINIAFTEKPVSDSLPCDAYLVGWGERNRLAAPLVTPRSRAALNLVLDETSAIETYLDNELGLSEPMIAGVDWCSNHTPSALLNADAQLRSRSATLPRSSNQGIQAGHLFQEMIEFDRAIHRVETP